MPASNRGPVRRKPVSILGHSVELVSRHAKLLDFISGQYSAVDKSTVSTGIRLFLELSDKPQKPLTATAAIDINEQKLHLENGATHAFADRQTQTARLQLCKQLLKSPYLLRHQVLNHAAWFLLCDEYLAPLRCSAFELNGRVFVCIGDGQSGKSNLALAAARNNFPLLCDDQAFIDDHGRIFADCREVHLPKDSLRRFSFLKSKGVQQSFDGRQRYVVTVPERLRMDSANQTILVFIRPTFSSKESSLMRDKDLTSFANLLAPQSGNPPLAANIERHHLYQLAGNPAFMARLGSDTGHFLRQLQALKP